MSNNPMHRVGRLGSKSAEKSVMRGTKVILLCGLLAGCQFFAPDEPKSSADAGTVRAAIPDAGLAAVADAGAEVQPDQAPAQGTDGPSDAGALADGGAALTQRPAGLTDAVKVPRPAEGEFMGLYLK